MIPEPYSAGVTAAETVADLDPTVGVVTAAVVDAVAAAAGALRRVAEVIPVIDDASPRVAGALRGEGALRTGGVARAEEVLRDVGILRAGEVLRAEEVVRAEEVPRAGEVFRVAGVLHAEGLPRIAVLLANGVEAEARIEMVNGAARHHRDAEATPAAE